MMKPMMPEKDMMMPMKPKGKKVMSDFMSRYGGDKGKSAFYATANAKGKGSKFYQLAHGSK
jgi:hypothetical protein